MRDAMTTETTTTATIEARLARLEATARRWRLLACGLVVAVCAMGAADAGKEAHFDVVTAKSFQCVDSDLRTVAVMACSKTETNPGFGMISIRDPNSGTETELVTMLLPGQELKATTRKKN
jgi:hypothetical protein